MESLLRTGQSIFDDGFDGVGGEFQCDWKFFLLCRGKVFENESCGVHLAGWAADSNANTDVIVGTERGYYVAEAVVTGVAATELDADVFGRDVEFIVDHDDVVWFDAIELGETRDRAARGVHVAQGFSEDDLLAADAESAFASVGVRLVFAQLDAETACQNVDDHLANVVAVKGVVGPRIPEPDYEVHLDYSAAGAAGAASSSA